MLLQARHTVKWILLDYIQTAKYLPHSQLSIACSMSNRKGVWEWDQGSGNETRGLGMRPAACTCTVTESQTALTGCLKTIEQLHAENGAWHFLHSDCTDLWGWEKWDIVHMTSWRREHLLYWHVVRSPIDRGHHWPVEDSTWSDRVTHTMVFGVVYISDGLIPRPFILL